MAEMVMSFLLWSTLIHGFRSHSGRTLIPLNDERGASSQTIGFFHGASALARTLGASECDWSDRFRNLPQKRIDREERSDPQNPAHTTKIAL